MSNCLRLARTTVEKRDVEFSEQDASSPVNARHRFTFFEFSAKCQLRVRIERFFLQQRAMNICFILLRSYRQNLWAK